MSFTPPSAPWLSDTLNGLDLYKLGFGMTPTIYFDPGATATSRTATKTISGLAQAPPAA